MPDDMKLVLFRLNQIDERLEGQHAAIVGTRTALDEHREDFRAHQLAVEHRVTKLETRAGAWGALSGLVAGLLAAIGIRH